MCFTRSAFTLAEVLITLAIIGVVAALTIPTLTAQYKKQVTVTRLKTFYSMFNQATLLSAVDNGEVSGWDFPSSGWNGAQARAFFEKYYLPYLKLTKYCGTDINAGCGGSSNAMVNMLMPNGVQISATGPGGVGAGIFFYFVVDINGFQKPNKSGIDIFLFETTKSDGFFIPYTREGSSDASLTRRENLLNKCVDSNGQCAGLIQLDGWEIKDDYPVKF